MRVSITNPDTLSPHTEDADLVWVLARLIDGDVVDIEAIESSTNGLGGRVDRLTNMVSGLAEVITQLVSVIETTMEQNQRLKEELREKEEL